MRVRIPVSSIENLWSDAQRVDQNDLNVEQTHNDQMAAAIVNNFFGSGVLLEYPEQNILFDSDFLNSAQAALKASNDFDGSGINLDVQPSDGNLGNQLEVELTGSMVFGRISTKVALIGLSFDDELIMDRFEFRNNGSRVTGKHYKKVLAVFFNDFFGNNNGSENFGGRIVIKEAKPFQLSRDEKPVAQDVMPDLFWRDFRLINNVLNLFSVIQTAIGPEYNANTLEINTTAYNTRRIEADDVVSQVGQKFLANTNNIQKITLLLGVDDLGSPDNFNWTGDLIVSVYPLQTNVNCPTDIIPNLAIDYDPSPVPLVELSFSQAELANIGYVLNDIPQPVDFVFNATKIGTPGGIIPGNYYAVTFRRSGAANLNAIWTQTGTDRLAKSRLTLFSGVWTDVQEEDMWFRIYSDASKVATGSGYDMGNGCFYPKTTVDRETGAIIDYSAEHFSFSTTGESQLNIGIIEAAIEQTLEAQDERTGDNIFSRKQYVPSFSFVNEAGLVSLQSTLEPFIIGCTEDNNPKLNSNISGITSEPGLVNGNTFCILNPDADLLSMNLVGSKLIPNIGNPLEYRIFKTTICTDLYGDVNGDGIIDEDDVTRCGELILLLGSLPLTDSTVQAKLFAGDFTVLEFLRADVNGDGVVDGDDLVAIQNFVDKSSNTFIVGTYFTHLCLTVQEAIGRWDDPNNIPYLPSNINNDDSAFYDIPFAPLDYEIIAQPFWDEVFVTVSSDARELPAAFTYNERLGEISCNLDGSIIPCHDTRDLVNSCDPGRNDIYIPNNLIIGKGQILRANGEPFASDIELKTIILQLPEEPFDQANINIFSNFLVDINNTGYTSNKNTPAGRYYDCTTVQPIDITLNKIRFSVSIQSLVPSLDGYQDGYGYGVIVDNLVGLYIDQATGILTITAKDLYVDPIYKNLITKIQVSCWLKKSGWKNDVVELTPAQFMALVT